MAYQFVSAEEVQSLRRKILPPGLADALSGRAEAFVAPISEVAETCSHDCCMVFHTPSVQLPDNEVLHFGLVTAGVVDYDYYLAVEEQFVRVTHQLRKLSPRFMAQVAFTMAPASHTAFRRYFNARQKKIAEALFEDLSLRYSRQPWGNIISSEDEETFEVLMRLGMREWAQHTFVLPDIELLLWNDFDMVLVLYSPRAAFWTDVAGISSRNGLVLKEMRSGE